ncbi:MAG TPA: hypothetical protein VMU04_04330 [Candidatus Acidoferrum sp.]|nr:hypothetical protein [Candidatus Acidoferrum sp.]
MKSSQLLLAAAAAWLLASGQIASADTLLDVSSSLSVSDPTQLGRLARDGVGSAWSGAKGFPGAINITTSYHYRLLTVFSSPPLGHFEVTSHYVQVILEDTNAAFFVSAYLDSFAPNPTATNRGLDINYLGDPGTSGDSYGTDPRFFQVFVPAGHDLSVVVTDVSASNAGIGQPFRVLVEGFTDTQFSDSRPAIVSTAISNTSLVLNATNGIAGRTYDVLTSTNVSLPLSLWAPVQTNVLATSGSFLLNVTNLVNPLDHQRFITLQSPTD